MRILFLLILGYGVVTAEVSHAFYPGNGPLELSDREAADFLAGGPRPDGRAPTEGDVQRIEAKLAANGFQFKNPRAGNVAEMDQDFAMRAMAQIRFLRRDRAILLFNEYITVVRNYLRANGVKNAADDLWFEKAFRLQTIVNHLRRTEQTRPLPPALPVFERDRDALLNVEKEFAQHGLYFEVVIDGNGEPLITFDGARLAEFERGQGKKADFRSVHALVKKYRAVLVEYIDRHGSSLFMQTSPRLYLEYIDALELMLQLEDGPAPKKPWVPAPIRPEHRA